MFMCKWSPTTINYGGPYNYIVLHSIFIYVAIGRIGICTSDIVMGA